MVQITNGDKVIGVVCVLLVVDYVAVGLRYMSRNMRRQPWGIDDWLATIVLVRINRLLEIPFKPNDVPNRCLLRLSGSCSCMVSCDNHWRSRVPLDSVTRAHSIAPSSLCVTRAGQKDSIQRRRRACRWSFIFKGGKSRWTPHFLGPHLKKCPRPSLGSTLTSTSSDRIFLPITGVPYASLGQRLGVVLLPSHF